MIVVNFVKPDSAFFCDAKICEAPPIPKIPSPLGECKSTNKISKSADIICTTHKKVINVIFVSLFYIHL